MIILHANDEEHYFGLEELHDRLGLMTETEVHFYAGGSHIPELKTPAVVFALAPCDGIRGIPGSVEMQQRDGVLYCATDIPGFIVGTLSRDEETGGPRDRYGRMPLSASGAFDQGVHETAYLDRLIKTVGSQVTDYFARAGALWHTVRPSDTPIACLTHDIDSIKGKSIIRYLFWVIKGISGGGRGLEKAFKKIRAFAALPEDPHFSFRRFGEMEKRFGFRSTFFALSLPFFLGYEGRRYSIRNRELSGILRGLRAEGWEVGLHPSRRSYLRQSVVARETARLASSLNMPRPAGVRNHYLKASFPETWRAHEEQGFHYDATLGWAESPGFRAGTAWPYRPFDRGKQCRCSLWELPLIAMDVAMDAGPFDIHSKCVELAEECFESHGPFTLLWHTDHLCPLDYPLSAPVYEKLLAYFSGKQCRGMTANDVIRVYDEHQKKMAAARRRSRDG